MSLSYPLTPPASPAYASRELIPRTMVGFNQSPFTGAQQVYAWSGQWLAFQFSLPAMKDAVSGPWEAFFMALNGSEGSFYLGDSVRKVSLGNPSGSWQVGAGAVANSTVLPLQNGAGSFAVGDWLQVGAATASRLHRVLQVNVGSVDVFPRLRSAYAQGTAITYTNAKGIFRLAGLPSFRFDRAKVNDGLSFEAVEVLP